MKRTDLFRQVDPPPGGLARLRAAMAEPRRARMQWLIPSVALGAVLIAALLVRPQALPKPVESEPVALAEADRSDTALLRVPTANPNVIFYWVDRIDGHP